MGLWYPKGSGFELTAFSDADHTGCIDTHKSTSRGIQFLGDKLVSWMSKKQELYSKVIAEAESHGDIISCLLKTEYQLADMFTKALLEDRFQYLVRRIGMRCLTLAELEEQARIRRDDTEMMSLADQELEAHYNLNMTTDQEVTPDAA
ncbi:hypothetical protein Tco_1482586 [Tanacetum coccineum]